MAFPSDTANRAYLLVNLQACQRARGFFNYPDYVNLVALVVERDITHGQRIHFQVVGLVFCNVRVHKIVEADEMVQS